MNKTKTGPNMLNWITLALAIIFFIFGLCIITGLFIPENLVLAGRVRIVIGLVLIGYGTIRAMMIVRRMGWGKRS